MADEKKRGAAMASALFGGEGPGRGMEESEGEPDTEGAYSEAVQAFMDAVNGQDVEGAKVALREAIHFGNMLGPPGMPEESSESEE